jgi:hypothetical protein
VAAAAPDVQNEGRKVKPRRSERRPRVPDVGVRVRGVGARTLWVMSDVPRVSYGESGVWDDASKVARDGQHVRAEARVVVSRSR